MADLDKRNVKFIYEQFPRKALQQAMQEKAKERAAHDLSMKVTIDEDGEMTVESSSGTVTINEEKSRRQIAAAATAAD